MSKMAVIYTDLFLDQKTGIAKFNSVVTKLNGEFQKTKDELTQMQTRAQTLESEINKLREAGRSDIKVIAGGVIPPQDYDYLRDAGVQGIYGPGSNVVECAADVLRLLGHNMPPLEDAA